MPSVTKNQQKVIGNKAIRQPPRCSAAFGADGSLLSTRFEVSQCLDRGHFPKGEGLKASRVLSIFRYDEVGYTEKWAPGLALLLVKRRNTASANIPDGLQFRPLHFVEAFRLSALMEGKHRFAIPSFPSALPHRGASTRVPSLRELVASRLPPVWAPTGPDRRKGKGTRGVRSGPSWKSRMSICRQLFENSWRFTEKYRKK